jgi:hypothetical protein
MALYGGPRETEPAWLNRMPQCCEESGLQGLLQKSPALRGFSISWLGNSR